MDVLGIDVGGTTVKAARVAADGSVSASETIATPPDAVALTAAVVTLAEGLRSPSTTAVGIACPGVVDDGVVRYAANLQWRNEPIGERLQAALEVPVVVTRDVAAAALAESAQVTGDDVLFVSVGTGIACAHIVGGELRRGATGQAGEMGHSPVRPDGELCVCGQRGCLEVYSSAAAIARRYATRTGVLLTTAQIAARIDADADANAVWQEAVDTLALALATDTLVNDPAVIVIGGGLAGAGDQLLVPLECALAARLVWRTAPPVVAAVLGSNAGPLGAAQLAWRASTALEQEGTPT